MFGESFYFSLIRKYVIVFGTLFNDIKITRTDTDNNITNLIRVPIIYSPKDKMLGRVLQDPNIDRKTAIQLPLMSFEMTNFSYDSTRKLQSLNRIVVVDPDDKSKNKYQYSPVPYNIDFTLSIYVKNAEDGTKIIEQILPWFTPDWNVTVNLIPEMNVVVDIPVILNDIDLSDTYADGNLEDRRAIIWTLNFTLKGYFYGPEKTSKIIKFVNTQLFVVSGDISSAVGNSTPVAYITVQPGLTANGEPTSNAENSIAVSEIEATDDYGFVITIGEGNDIE